MPADVAPPRSTRSPKSMGRPRYSLRVAGANMSDSAMPWQTSPLTTDASRPASSTTIAASAAYWSMVNSSGRVCLRCAGQLGDPDDRRFAAQSRIRRVSSRRGRATVAVPGISTSSPRRPAMSSRPGRRRPSTRFAVTTPPNVSSSTGVGDRPVLHRVADQPAAAADPVGEGAGQQRRLQRTLHQHVVVPLDRRGPVLVVVDAVAVVGGGAEEEHLRLVDGHRAAAGSRRRVRRPRSTTASCHCGSLLTVGRSSTWWPRRPARRAGSR